jgi:hypothetical protein
MPITHRRTLRLVVVTALAALLAALLVTPAVAAPTVSYRFWGFFQYTDGAWAFAQKGPAETVPADGSVEGWRFAVSGSDSSRYPRATATFDEICAGTPAQAGKKRVGVIIDFGRTADAEDGATPPAPVAVCAALAPDQSSVDALQAAGGVRSDKGLICAVRGYPATGCGGEVKQVPAAAKAADTPVAIPVKAGASASPSASASASADAVAAGSSSEQGSGVSTGTWVGIVLVLAVLALVAVAALRRRRA